MNDDDIDVMLREYAPRWRDAQPPPPTVEAAERAARRAAADPASAPAWRTALRWPSRPWLPVLATAAAVALLTGGIGVLRTYTATEPGHTPTPSPSPAIVPWRALPERDPAIPNTVVSPSPDPAPAADLRPCRIRDLRASSRRAVAGGTRTIEVRFWSSEPCQVNGYPNITPMDADRRPVAVPVERSTPEYGNPVALGGSAIAVVALAWTSSWCADEVDVARLLIYFTAGSVIDIQGFGKSQCYGVPGSGTKAPIRVTEFRPERFTTGHLGTVYDDVATDVLLPATAKAGETIRFRVTLTAPRDIALDPCPDYSIRFATAVAYGLDCDAVPYRDRAGRPYLPAGIPVSFAMQATAPATATAAAKVIWQLEDTAAAGGGTVDVLVVR
jgi:hypothetical protein